MGKTVDINTKEEIKEEVNETVKSDKAAHDPEAEVVGPGNDTDKNITTSEDSEVLDDVKETIEEATGKSDNDIPLEVYKVGNLKFKCHCCSHEYIVEEGIQGGVRFELYATNKHKLAMACPKCKAVLEMYFEKGDDSGLVDVEGNTIKKSTKTNPDITDEIIDAEMQEPQVEDIDGEMMAEKDVEMSEHMPEDVKAEIENENNTDNEIPVQEENK